MKPQIYTEEHRFYENELKFSYCFNPDFIRVYLCVSVVKFSLVSCYFVSVRG